MWKKYEVELQMTGYFAASLPRMRDEIEKMLANRMPAKPPEDFIPLDELADEVAEKVGAPAEGEEEEEIKYGWATFPRNEDGLYYEGRCVRGHLKDCANQVKGAIKPDNEASKAAREKLEKDLKSLKARVANKVYVMTDVIPLMIDGVQAKEIGGTEQRFVQVMTKKGPRSTIKYVDYLEKPTLKFQLNVLDDGIITEDILKAIFEYGSIHGLGQERSQGWGRYTFTITEI
ncbi:MAG: hypothetical protein Q7J06_09825 [Bacteroidales bacterium]|nr:hypothetical protein [Bacteroidales bacterium]